MWKVYFLVLCLTYLALAGAQDDHYYRRSDLFNRLREAYFKRDFLDKRGVCIDLGKPCRSSLAWKPRCCGDTVCYWPNGISITKDGYCVECIGNNQKCQLGSQCCEGFFCRRESVVYVDGKCVPKRAKGEICHKNDNCLSGQCGHRIAASLWTKGRCM